MPPLTTAGLPRMPAARKPFLSSTLSNLRLSRVLKQTVETAPHSFRQATYLCTTQDPRSCHPLLMQAHWINTTVCSTKRERASDLLLRPVSTRLHLGLRARAQAKSLVIDLARAVCDACSISSSLVSSISSVCFPLFDYGYQEFKQARRNLLQPFAMLSLCLHSMVLLFLAKICLVHIFYTVGRSGQVQHGKGYRGNRRDAKGTPTCYESDDANDEIKRTGFEG